MHIILVVGHLKPDSAGLVLDAYCGFVKECARHRLVVVRYRSGRSQHHLEGVGCSSSIRFDVLILDNKHVVVAVIVDPCRILVGLQVVPEYGDQVVRLGCTGYAGVNVCCGLRAKREVAVGTHVDLGFAFAVERELKGEVDLYSLVVA